MYKTTKKKEKHLCCILLNPESSLSFNLYVGRKSFKIYNKRKIIYLFFVAFP